MKPDSGVAADARLWAMVTATVRPMPGRSALSLETPPDSAPSAATSVDPTRRSPKGSSSLRVSPPRDSAPQAIEPGRHRRLVRGRAEASIDLHGLDQDGARRALTRFILRAHAEGARTLLVITGKGVRGDGVLRRRTPEWLAEPPLRAVIAGISEAHRRHGGEGALYVALRRRSHESG